MSEKRLTELADRVFTATDSNRVTTIQEDLFVQGKSFSSRNIVVSPTAGAGYIDVLIDGRACNCSQIIFAPLSFVADEGPITITLHAGVVVSALGTELSSFNRRATSTMATGLKVYSGPTVTDAGTIFSSILVPASSAAIFTQGAQSSAGLPFEINKDVLYMARIANNNGTDANVEYNATWFEI